LRSLLASSHLLALEREVAHDGKPLGKARCSSRLPGRERPQDIDRGVLRCTANVPHAVDAPEPFKMLLLMIRG
jgi:hypothetical protein